jgi:UDP-galactopyranose mutase
MCFAALTYWKRAAFPALPFSDSDLLEARGKGHRSEWDYTNGDPLADCALSCRAVPYAELDPDADVLIVGAGLSGAILAYLHATLLNQRVLIVERRNHIAGNMYDYVDANGIRSSMYGPHYFHTVDERVWQFLNRFSEWHYYEYRVVANVTDINGKRIFPTIPINIDTANEVFGMHIQTATEMAEWLAKIQDKYPGGPKNAEEAARERVGKILYEKFFEGYTTKQWEKKPRDLYPLVTQRIPVWSKHDDRYFNDAHQAMPVQGFTGLIRSMLTHQNIRYLLNTEYFALPAVSVLAFSLYRFVFVQ